MRREAWKFLAVTGIVACIIIMILYRTWDYLNNSTSLTAALATHILHSPAISVFPNAQTSRQVSTSIMPKPESSYDGFLTYTFIDQGNAITYYLYVPAHYYPNKHYPLVLLLHGGGEKADPTKSLLANEQVLLNQGYAQVWSANYNGPANQHVQANWPCFVVLPQLTTSQNWVTTEFHQGSYTQTATPSTPLLLAKELVDALQRQYTGIDARRLYITGLSNGGVGVWDAIERWPDYFAVAVPISGSGDPSRAAVLKKMPIWAFHGTSDPVIAPSGSTDMINAIKAAGGTPRLTLFPGMGHVIWPYIYSYTNSSQTLTTFYPWLFAQKKA